MKRILIISVVLLGIFLLIWTNPALSGSGTVKIFDRNRILLYEQAGAVGSNLPVAYGDLPKYLIDAVVASEDRTFLTNPGVDVLAVITAIWQDIRAGRVVRGASTITQQVARMSVLRQQGRTDRSVVRKIREMLVALRLSASHPKKDILSLYLNSIYFGRMAYGIGAASQAYFGKHPSRLTLSESAYLAGLLSNPETSGSDFAAGKKRQAYVLTRMAEDGYISREKAAAAGKKPLEFSGSSDTIKASHFVAYILDQVKSLKIPVDKGLNITTTLEYPMTRLTEDMARFRIRSISGEHDISNAAVVVLENETGKILVMAGGIDYYDATHSGQVNMATALRQPGSALKPVTYAAAFMQGYTPATVLYDVKKVFTTKKGEGYAPNNYDGTFHGPVPIRVALASSLNMPAVDVLSKIGLPAVLKLAGNMGITTLTDTGRYDLSLTLGGGEVTLTDLTTAYATLARGGKFIPTYSIETITDDAGHELYRHKHQQPVQVLGPNGKQAAYLISNILSDPKARALSFGEKNPLVLTRPAAVKTGTTTDWHDNWTVGYTPSYTAGVWAGNNDNHPMRNISGITGAAPVWNQTMEEWLKDKPRETFVLPDGIVTADICTLSGKLDDGLCPERATEIFISGTEPKETSSLHKKVLIDSRNGLLAADTCPKSFTAEKILVEYPAESYSWAKENARDVLPREYSPLCAAVRNTTDSDTFVTITNPRQKAVFQSAPYLVANEKATFEVSVSPDITLVRWIVDGRWYVDSKTFPFQAAWTLMEGQHTISAVGITANGNKTESQEIRFSVTEFGEE